MLFFFDHWTYPENNACTPFGNARHTLVYFVSTRLPFCCWCLVSCDSTRENKQRTKLNIKLSCLSVIKVYGMKKKSKAKIYACRMHTREKNAYLRISTSPLRARPDPFDNVQRFLLTSLIKNIIKKEACYCLGSGRKVNFFWKPSHVNIIMQVNYLFHLFFYNCKQEIATY